MKPIEPPKYYQLRCATCSEPFRRLLATSEAELLYPDYEECEEHAGQHNTWALQEFHRAHRGHTLEAVEDSGNPGIPSQN